MSEENDGKLYQVRALWKDWLEGDEYFDDIEILEENIKDLNTKIRTAVAKLGLCVVLATPTASAVDKRQMSILLKSQLVARVYRNATTSANPKKASAVAERILQRSHGTVLDDEQQLMLRIDDNPIELSTESGDAKTPVVAYDAVLETQIFLKSLPFAKVATPTIVYDGTRVEMLCDTPGAAIYYTTNGKTPNATSGTLYTGQFITANPTVLKARAGAWQKLPSEVATATPGTVIPPEVAMTFESWRAQLNALSGNCKIDATGNLILKTDDDVAENRTLHVVRATKNGTAVSVVANDEEAVLT